MTGQDIIQVQALSKVYHQSGSENRALHDLSFSIKQGEFIVLMGRSGSGKSTLLHLLAGIDTPSTGSISISDHTITTMTEGERAVFRRQRIGLVFQSFNLLGNMTVLHNVMLPGLLLKQSRAAVKKRAYDLLDELELGAVQQRLPLELSGGQQQRVALARAMINTPDILLADEPTGNLDTQTGKSVLNLINSYHHRGQTVLLGTHDPEIRQVASRVFVLSDGVLVDQQENMSLPSPSFAEHRQQ